MSEMYPAIYEWENLQKAHRKAAKGKRGRQAAAEFGRFKRPFAVKALKWTCKKQNP